MAFNFLNFGGRLTTDSRCRYDSNLGYATEFDNNGSVDGWTYYDGIHTYGCWNSFLFGTLYGSYGTIGRGEVFLPVAAENFYIVRIIMKLNLKTRVGSQSTPSKGRLMWRTLSSTVWNSNKTYDFDLINDTEWNTYTIDLSDAQYWQGDVNDLRVYPILEDGRSGDEFFIKKIEIISNDTYVCTKNTCDYYNSYTHNCPGIGQRGYCKSYPLDAYVQGGTQFEFADTKVYNIVADVNDTLLVNINGYGYERITLDAAINQTGNEIAISLSKEISKLDVGGYTECEVDYNEYGQFIIYSGTYASDSVVIIGDNQLAQDLNFRSNSGADISIRYTGSDPASEFLPYSSFRAKTFQLYTLLDNNEKTSFSFDPSLYNVEGGRRDWLSTGLGHPTKDVRGSESDESGLMNRSLTSYPNAGKTIIDFNHPFNASGRVTKIYAAVTLDDVHNSLWAGIGADESRRLELEDAKIMFFRPNRDGNLRVLPTEISIPNRDRTAGELYSKTQEYIEIDCDIFVNKGDLIGVYNANVYIGKSISGAEFDANFYQINGKPSVGDLNPGELYGEGSGGLLIYARSNQRQDRLVLNMDFAKRVNITDIEITGSPGESSLDFNVARCLDINWEVDLFGLDHTTGIRTATHPIEKRYFNHPNLYYGVDCLSDGIKVVPDGLAADSFSVNIGTYYTSYYGALGLKDGGSGVIPEGPKYFHCNGDSEWLGIHMFTDVAYFAENDFQEDPIAFTIKFPLEGEKLIYKSKVYFKEQYNFRSFAMSTYVGRFYQQGDADDPQFNYIPNRDGYDTPWVKITLDGVDYSPDDEDRWSTIDLYLAENPCNGDIVTQITNVAEVSYDQTLDYYSDDHGLQYLAAGVVVNNEQYTQSCAVDWSTLGHEWEPIRAKGFRLYTDLHKSSKICEMELYCQVENVRSTMSSALDVSYSEYGDYWWPIDGIDDGDSAIAYIGDTPRYVEIVVKPINEIELSEIKVSVSYEDVFMGTKGCQHMFLPAETEVGSATNTPEVIYFKNEYGHPYDLYVDIAKDDIRDEGVVFFSLMSDDDSISNPLFGPDAYYKKHDEYIFRNYQGNVAINCPVYALKNLMEGASAWYSYDKNSTWKYYGQLTGGQDVDFSNIPDMSITVLNVPSLIRSEWWKVGFFDDRITTKVYQMQIFYQDVEITGVTFYHQKNHDVNYDSNNDTAPHLNDDVINGSYYVLEEGSYIGFRLPSVQSIDKIVLYHEKLEEYNQDSDAAGIDSFTGLCIHGEGDTYQTDTIVDDSYYEHAISVEGNVYCDESFTEDSYAFTEDFIGCEPFEDTFDGPDIDSTTWSGAINAYIDSGVLNITNSGIIGELTTKDYFTSDFDATVDMGISGVSVGRGWGCYLQARSDSGRVVRVGRTYHYEAPLNRAFCSEYGGSGWNDIEVVESSSIAGMSLRVSRAEGNTTCYFREDGGEWQDMGTSTVLGTDPVQLILMSDLTPLASGVTIAEFDNFVVDKSSWEWSINTDYSSSFTCTSGVGPNGWAYVYDTICANHADSGGFHNAHVFDVQSDPLDNDWEFTLDFAFETDQFLTSPTGSTTDSCGVSVGLVDKHSNHGTGYYPWLPYFTGAQVVLTRDRIGIAINNLFGEYDSGFVSLDTSEGPYYCRFSGDGVGTYRCQVWTDYWAGASGVVDFYHENSSIWKAKKIGVGSGYGGFSLGTNYRGTGWVSDVTFSGTRISPNGKIHRSSIRFNGGTDDRLVVDYDNNSQCNIPKEVFNLDTKYMTIDFYIKFSTLPADGEIVYIIKSWSDSIRPTSGGPASGDCSWAMTLENDSGTFYMRFYINKSGTCTRTLNHEYSADTNRWLHYYLGRGVKAYSAALWPLIENGYGLSNTSLSYSDEAVYESRKDIVIGQNLDGWMEEIRFSSDYSDDGTRILTQANVYYFSKAIPTRQYERFYTFSFYDSSDNIFYGKNMDVDVLFDNSYSYHILNSTWSENYYTYFAIDFGQRHAVDIVRSYPVDTAFLFNNTDNVLYSNKDTSDPYTAFTLTTEEQNVSTDFMGADYDYPSNWTKSDSTNALSYIKDEFFYQKCTPAGAQVYSKAVSKFNLYGNFDLKIDYELGTLNNGDSWWVGLVVEDINDDTNSLKCVRAYVDEEHQYAMWQKDSSSTWEKVFNYFRQPIRGTLRIVRIADIFSMYVKGIDEPDSAFELLGFYNMLNDFNLEANVSIVALSDTTTFPTLEVWWDNFVLTEGEPNYSDKQDARWMRIKMLNGDGEDRTIKNLDIFPDTSIQFNSLGEYNTYWEDLGSAVTSYTSGENIALSATVSGSSYVGKMALENAVDGLIYDGDIEKCWASDDEDNPWIAVYFSESQPVYRFKVYHGYSTTDTKNIITDYKIQVSDDGETFTTVFTITGNDEFERTHDLSSPVYAKVVRLYVDSYDALTKFVWTGVGDGYQFWSGAVLREFEVYKYYGFELINSEERPIIAIDLQQPYFITGHEIVGKDAEDDTEDWHNSSANFAWANDRLDDPKKVSFGSWGEAPYYAKWVLVKRNTATHYPQVPDSYYPHRDTPDYLKHVVIKASADESGTKPNPIEYPWMWRSNVSELNYDYDVISEGVLGSRTLRIAYPAGTDSEHVRFIEGDHFGWDDVCSWRDGFGINVYIDDVNNLDLDYGYFYLGGYDATQLENEVTFRWNMSTTLSGILVSGWNQLQLTFMYADEEIYTEPASKIEKDPRRLYTIKWSKAGFVFRGKGSALQMNIEGMYIARNYFAHGAYPGQKGLYIHGQEFLKARIGELSLNAFTIEFWIRPDWNWDSADVYDDFKYRTLFHVGNVANDVFGAVVSSRGLEVYYGNLLQNLNVSAISGMTFNVIDRLTHFAFTCSNTGTKIGGDGSTIRVYINNILVGKSTTTWDVSDDKFFDFRLGGQGVLLIKNESVSPVTSSVDGVVCRLKVYNYCKTDFTESATDSEYNYQRTLLKPSNFIEISKDNVTYHKVDSSELPFFFDDVGVDESIPIWVRVTVPKGLTGAEKRTAKVIGSWDIGV